MDFAIRASDEELVLAKDCKDTKESPYGFYCPYCKSEMMLKSYKSSNVPPPYFAAAKPISNPHTNDCVLKKKESGEKGGTDSSNPLPYKNKLVIEKDIALKGEQKLHTSPSINQDEKPSRKPYHNNTAKHLAPIVDYYLQDPQSRGDLELEVPGCSYRKYKSIFQRIYWFPEKNYKGTHVFFGSLFFKNPFEEYGEDIIFNLYQNENTEPIRVFLHTEGWKDSAKFMAKYFVREAIGSGKDAYKNGIGNISPCIFFLGSVDENSKRIFHCYNHASFYASAVSRDNLDILTKDTSNYGIFYPSRENVVSPEIAFEQNFSNEENETVSSDVLDDRPNEIIIERKIETQLQFDKDDEINILTIQNTEKFAEEVDFSGETPAKNNTSDRNAVDEFNVRQKAETIAQSYQSDERQSSPILDKKPEKTPWHKGFLRSVESSLKSIWKKLK
jgi:hypothetical protein